MTFLEMEMKELGISDYNNTHNKRSLIRTLKYVPDIVADGKSINTHTHTHTRTRTRTRTHTHPQSAWFEGIEFQNCSIKKYT